MSGIEVSQVPQEEEREGGGNQCVDRRRTRRGGGSARPGGGAVYAGVRSEIIARGRGRQRREQRELQKINKGPRRALKSHLDLLEFPHQVPMACILDWMSVSPPSPLSNDMLHSFQAFLCKN